MLPQRLHLPRLETAQLNSKRVLLRIELESVLDQSARVKNPVALLNLIPTINFLLQRGASVLILTHLSQSQNKKALELHAVAEYLSQLLKQTVEYMPSSIASTRNGDRLENSPAHPVVLLENLDLYPKEKSGHKDFAVQLAKLGEVYVNEARSANSKEYASLVHLPKLLPSYAGLGLAREWEFFQTLLIDRKKIHLLLGGLSFAKKLNFLKKFLLHTHTLAIGGSLSYSFLRSRAVSIGRSVHEEALDVPAFQFIEKAELEQVNMIFPLDHLVAKQINSDSAYKTVSRIPEEWIGVDIGPRTLGLFERELKQASTVLWHGPLGVVEVKKFGRSSHSIAKFLAKSKARVCAIGQDTTNLIYSAGKYKSYEYLEPDSQFVLDALEQKAFPGLLALAKD